MSPRTESFVNRIRAGEILLGDGAWGTQMQKMGLQFGDCPEEWNAAHPDRIRRIAKDYFDAGADFCLTNTFGANRYRLVRHGHADDLRDYNIAGAKLSFDVAGDKGIVAASVGPTGEFVEPEGMLAPREMTVAFREQMSALKEGGVEIVCIETMYVVEEAVLAIKAARDLGLFCMAAVTFDSTPDGFRTMLGSTIEDATLAIDAAGADVVGTNCGNGINEMVEIARQMRSFTKKPLLVKSNAGMPETVDGKLLYRETPEIMARRIVDLKAAGVSIIGGCCGTTPEHIRAFRTVIESAK